MGLFGESAKPTPADWSLWSQMPKAALWQAVLLSLDADPEGGEPRFHSLFRNANWYGEWDEDFLKECRRRLTIAQAALSMGDSLRPLTPLADAPDDPQAMVDLRSFGKWARSLGWTLPGSFPVGDPVPVAVSNPTISAGPPDNSQSNDAGPRSRAETTYLNIIGALLELVLSYREGRNSEAAVIQELVENYRDKPGISKSNLESKFAEAKRRLKDS